MGKKNRKQLTSDNPAIAPRQPAKKPRQLWQWLLIAGAILGLLLIGIIVVVAKNFQRLLPAGIRYTVQQVHNELLQNSAQFTLEERRELKIALLEIDRIARSGLDTQLAGHLNFLLKVINEIVREGKLQAGELEKLRFLVEEGKRYQKRRFGSSPPGH